MKKTLLVFGAIIGVLATYSLTLSPSVSAKVDPYKNCLDSVICDAADQQGEEEVGNLVEKIINLLLTITSVISVIMIIIGGIRYTVSNGDSNAASSAKNTILYSVIGLVIAIFAYAIVKFVVDNLK